jgi:hypothetical protein
MSIPVVARKILGALGLTRQGGSQTEQRNGGRHRFCTAII